MKSPQNLDAERIRHALAALELATRQQTDGSLSPATIPDIVQSGSNNPYRIDLRHLAERFSQGYRFEQGYRAEDPAGDTVVPSFLIMSLISLLEWYSAGTEGDMHAGNFFVVLKAFVYSPEAIVLMRTGEHDDLLDLEEDAIRRGARLLGRVSAACMNPKMLDLFLEVLSPEIEHDGMRRLIIQGSPALTAEASQPESLAQSMLMSFFNGLRTPSAAPPPAPEP